MSMVVTMPVVVRFSTDSKSGKEAVVACGTPLSLPSAPIVSVSLRVVQ